MWCATAFLSDLVGILASVSRLPAVNPPRSRRLAASALRTRVGIAALALMLTAVAMFTEEVGVDPRLGDGGVGYRARVAELVQAGRAFARFEGDEVVFKAEIGALSRQVGQIQGVWVHPDRRGHGLGTIGTAAVTDRLAAMGRVSSLYVNGFNTVARRAYTRIGLRQVGSFATVLF